MTNPEDFVYPYAWKAGLDGKTPVINENVSALTKREHFSLQILQGFISTMGNDFVPNEQNVNYFVDLSVKTTDLLIKKLNNELQDNS